MVWTSSVQDKSIPCRGVNPTKVEFRGQGANSPGKFVHSPGIPRHERTAFNVAIENPLIIVHGDTSPLSTPASAWTRVVTRLPASGFSRIPPRMLERESTCCPAGSDKGHCCPVAPAIQVQASNKSVRLLQ
jgi:hypothetical protein